MTVECWGGAMFRLSPYVPMGGLYFLSQWGSRIQFCRIVPQDRISDQVVVQTIDGLLLGGKGDR
jgi:hypothetical protein